MANLQAVGRDVPAPQTLNDRLNQLGANLELSCAQLDGVLGRVNGTPQALDKCGSTAPTPQFAMAEMVSRLEEQAQKLASLVEGVQRIA